MLRFVSMIILIVSCATIDKTDIAFYKGLSHYEESISVDLRANKYTAFLFMSSRCPCSESHNHIVKELAIKYKEIKFVGVHSNYNEKIKHAKKYFKGIDFDFPIIYDKDSVLAKEFGAVKTPHVFIVNSHGKVIYSGNITNSSNGRTAKINHLKIAFDDIRSGIEPKISQRKSLGCYIPLKD